MKRQHSRKDVPPSPELQTAPAVLMIRPAAFAPNPETAATNVFQKVCVRAALGQPSGALGEFDELADCLRACGVTVKIAADAPRDPSPDSIFPNNWVSTHADGTVVLYPMLAENRRRERRLELVKELARRNGYRITRVLDLSRFEEQGKFLEGTGSLVLDRVARVAYACLSSRTHPEPLAEWARELGYETVAFHASDTGGRPIYHTNVMMCIGDRFAVVCLESIRDPAERSRVVERLESSGHEVIPITQAQMAQFSGNMLQLAASDGGTVLVMSSRARSALTDSQTRRLAQYARLLDSPIDTIEDCGGGSVRCMLAEICLPRV